MENFVKIMDCVKRAVKNCGGYVEYDFYAEENVVSVRIFEYDDYAEYCDDFEYYNFTLLTAELFDKLKTDCSGLTGNIEVYTPNKYDKMGYGYFNYLEILITPIN